jgi:ATP-dependent DNA ligase
MLNPMLARRGSFDKVFTRFDQGARLVQPKLNGIRAIWDPDRSELNTRNGRSITSVPHIIKAIKSCSLSDFPLDGEIFCQDLPFQKINGLVGAEVPNEECGILEFHCFDIAMPGATNADRCRLLRTMKGTRSVKIVETHEVTNCEDLTSLYNDYLRSGYEGIIVRRPEAFYKFGLDGDWMLKIKPVFELEATLIGFNVESEGGSGISFKSLSLQLKTGQKFNCTGLNAMDRAMLWETQPIGSQVTVIYGALTDRGVPMFPRFKGLRWDK